MSIQPKKVINDLYKNWIEKPGWVVPKDDKSGVKLIVTSHSHVDDIQVLEGLTRIHEVVSQLDLQGKDDDMAEKVRSIADRCCEAAVNLNLDVQLTESAHDKCLEILDVLPSKKSKEELKAKLNQTIKIQFQDESFFTIDDKLKDSLIQSSTYFKVLFSGHFEEAQQLKEYQQLEIAFDDIDLKELKTSLETVTREGFATIVDMIYWKIDDALTPDNVDSTLRAASYLGIDSVLTEIGDFLAATIEEEIIPTDFGNLEEDLVLMHNYYLALENQSPTFANAYKEKISAMIKHAIATNDDESLDKILNQEFASTIESLNLQGVENLSDIQLDKITTKIPDLKVINLKGCVASTAGFDHLRRLSKLTSLNLEGTNVTDQTLATIGNLGTLQTLKLSGSQTFTNAGIAHLRNLTNLRELGLARCNNIRLGVLDIFPNLRVLNVAGIQFSDDDFLHVANLEHLEELHIQPDYPVTGQGLSEIRRLQNLKILDLKMSGFLGWFGGRYTDTPPGAEEFFAELGNLPRLEKIELLGGQFISAQSFINLTLSQSLREIGACGVDRDYFFDHPDPFFRVVAARNIEKIYLMEHKTPRGGNSLESLIDLNVIELVGFIRQVA